MELLRLVVFLNIITKYEASAVATLTCDDFFNFSDLDSKINDTFSAGDILFNVSDEIQFSNDCEDEPLLSITTSSEVSDKSVVSLTMNVSEYCKSLIFCVFQCTKSQKSLIIQAPVKLTQEYDLQFEETIYTANVSWMSETGTPVTINKDLNLIVENCSTDVMFPSYTGRYSLDESLNVVPFKWMSEASGNSLFVSEDLNETIPVFNVIVLASLTNTNDHRLKGTATATIIVSVIDDTDGCNVNPCVNEGTCVYLTFGEYRCDCSEDWTGKHCDVDNNMIKPVEDTSIISIIGGTLGAVFGILLVICVTVIVLRKYKKDKDLVKSKCEDIIGTYEKVNAFRSRIFKSKTSSSDETALPPDDTVSVMDESTQIKNETMESLAKFNSSNEGINFGNKYEVSIADAEKIVKEYKDMKSLESLHQKPSKGQRLRSVAERIPTPKCKNFVFHFPSTADMSKMSESRCEIKRKCILAFISKKGSFSENIKISSISKLNRLLSLTELLACAEEQSKISAELFPRSDSSNQKSKNLCSWRLPQKRNKATLPSVGTKNKENK